MKIAIYGIFTSGSLPSLLYSSFISKNICTYKFDLFERFPVLGSSHLLKKVIRKSFDSLIKSQINKSLAKFCSTVRPDFLVLSGAKEISLETLIKIKRLNIVIVDWNPDEYTNPLNGGYKLSPQLQYIDILFSARSHMFDIYKLLGAKECVFLDWYYVDRFHFSRNLDEKYLISFVGSWSPLRELFMSQIDAPINIWGYGWQKASPYFLNKHEVSFLCLNQDDMSKVFAQSCYNLNLFTVENHDFTNLRMFEVTASHSLLLSPTNPHVEKYLKPNIDFLSFATPADVNDFLSSPPKKYLSVLDSGYHSIVKDNSNSFNARFEILFSTLSDF